MQNNTTQDISFTRALKLGESLLGEGKTIKVTAGGDSMWPFIRKGNVVYIKQSRDYKVGDIIVYKTDLKFVAHRLLKIQIHKNHKLYISKGDSRIRKDKPLLYSEIKGKIIAVHKAHRYINYENSFRVLLHKKLATSHFLLSTFNWLTWKILNRINRIK